MKLLRFTTIQAPNQDFIIRDLAAYLGKRLGIPTEFVIDVDWQEREQLLDSGQVQVGWICGLPYVWKADQPDPQIELLAAPVMLSARYQNQPLYFSDVIVRRLSPYLQFEDLAGSRWAYNEPHSHSGYNITRFHLAQMGAYLGFFGSVVGAGSHQNSIAMLLAGQVDAAAIDSTVLEIEQQADGTLTRQLRVIATLGPSPIPPLVISKAVEAVLRAEVREALLEMHTDEQGREMLAAGGIKRFTVVSDRDYDPIRRMAESAAPVRW